MKTNLYNTATLLSVALLICMCSCSDRIGSNFVATPDTVSIERFDRDIIVFADMDSADRVQFKNKYKPALDFLVPVASAGTVADACHDSIINAYADSRAVTVFEPDVERFLPALDSVEQVVSMAKAKSENLFPDIVWPRRLIGIVSPYNQSMIFSDSCLLVGLNHYLGRDYVGYGCFEPYQRRFKDCAQLPVRLVESVIINNYPYCSSSESTALSKMLYDGAVLWGVKQALPDTPDSVLMGWSSGQTEWVEENIPQIWQTMIERNLLFTTNKTVGDRLTRYAPVTTLISPEAPGRLGSYIGMLVVDGFLKENKQAEPKQMLDSAVYNSSSTLVKSGFAPQLRR